MSNWFRCLSLIVIVALFSSPVFATEVEKKWRLGLAIGGYNTDDDVPSDSANSLTLFDENLLVVDTFFDPRNDSGVFGDLGAEAAQRITFSTQYAFNRFFLIEGSIGYQKGDVGDVEVQAQFPGQEIPIEKNFDFQIYRFKAGEMEQIPLQISVISRFRPRANFNPFLTAGVGYTVVGFEPDAELNTLSTNISNSTGAFAPYSGFQGFEGFARPQPSEAQPLTGAFVEANDTFTWHIGGGAELTLKGKWSAFADFRYNWASRSMTIGFNGNPTGLGTGVPSTAVQEDSVQFEELFLSQSIGTYEIFSGGIVDGGQLSPLDTAPSGTDCDLTPNLCEFIFVPDGELDIGTYYVQGGSFNLGGISLQLGLRYTF